MRINIKKYLFLKIFIIFFIFLIFNILVYISSVLGFKSLQQELVNHQLSKINNNPKIVFLGDSSLGHSINSNLWSSLSGKKTSNLALTGNFSFGGSNAILREILKKNKNLETVIIVNNLYAWQEEVKFSGYEYINKQKNFFLKYLNYLDKNIFEIKNFYFNFFLKKNNENYSNLIINDFMKHGKKITKDASYRFDINRFNRNKSFFLKKIINACNDFNINCIYFHGPIYENACIDENYVFFKKVNDELSTLDIMFSNEIECLNYEQIGDTIYHASPKYKNEITKRYYKKYLAINY